MTGLATKRPRKTLRKFDEFGNRLFVCNIFFCSQPSKHFSDLSLLTEVPFLPTLWDLEKVSNFMKTVECSPFRKFLSKERVTNYEELFLPYSLKL